MPQITDCAYPVRPRIGGHFEAPDKAAKPLLTAIGQAIWAVTALEHSLLLGLVRLFLERQVELRRTRSPRFEGLPAGPLLKELRRMQLPFELDERISDAIVRRNDLLHHPIEGDLSHAQCGDRRDRARLLTPPRRGPRPSRPANEVSPTLSVASLPAAKRARVGPQRSGAGGGSAGCL